MSEKTRDYNAEPLPDDESHLRGGTQGGEAARAIDPNVKREGTPSITAPSGGAFAPPPSRAVPNTDAGRSETDPEHG